jgi:predicted DNA binding CopG/RHH family protein
MRKISLTRQEKNIEESLLKGEYIKMGKEEYVEIAQALAERRKDAVLNIRVNSQDLKQIKQKARNLGIKYQTFISEILHKVART